MILKYVKKDNDNYSTIRQVLNQEFNISSNLQVRLKKAKKIFLNGLSTYVDAKIKSGDVITREFDT